MSEELGSGAVLGRLEPAVADELPGLALHWLAVDARDGPSPPGLVWQLRGLSDRYRGGAVVAMRTKPIPAAYRTFFRQIGLDPDTTRIPSEEAAVARLFHGTFKPQGHVADALLVALVETGIPVWALDAASVDADSLGIRTARPGDQLGRGSLARSLEPGTLVVADEKAVHTILFGQAAPDPAVTRRTTRMVLYSVSVPGVPAIHLEEAFWLAVEGLQMER